MTKPIFTKTESESILQDINPNTIITTTSIPYLASKFSEQTSNTLKSLQSPKKIIEFIRRKSESDGFFTVYFMVFFVKTKGAKRGMRCFLFLNSLKDLSIYHTLQGTEEKFGKVTSLEIIESKQKLIFHQENGRELRFRIKSDNISGNLYSAINDFFNDKKTPFQDFFTSFLYLPKEQVEMFLPLKESLKRLLISIDLDFVIKLFQLNLDENQLNEIGQIAYTLFSNYDSLFYVVYCLINLSLAFADNPDDLFKNNTIFTVMMLKWIHTSCFSFYQNASNTLKKLYSEIFINENDKNDENKIKLFYDRFLNEIKLGKTFPESLSAVAGRIYHEVRKKFPENDNAPYFCMTRVFILKGLEELMGSSPEFLLVKDLLDFKLSGSDPNNSVAEKLKFSLREIATPKHIDVSMPKMNTNEKNLQYLAFLRFIFNNVESIFKLLNEIELQPVAPPYEKFLCDLLDALKNPGQM